MKHIKREIFKKLSFAYISIIFIPVLILGIYEISSISKNIKDRIKKDNFYTMTKIMDEINSAYSKVEKIKLLIRNDIEFLTFLTSGEERTAREYTAFQRGKIPNYEKLISISSEINHFKIYVENPALLEIQPLILNKIPENLLLDDRTFFIKENNKNYLYYFRKIYFHPMPIYLEVKLDIEKIIGNSFQNYYFFRDGEYLKINDLQEDYNLNNLLKENKLEINNSQFEFFQTDDVLMFHSYSTILDTHLFNVINRQNLVVQNYSYITTFIILALLSMITIYYISYFISIKIFKQLEYIVAAVKEIKGGNLDVKIPIEDKTDEFYTLSTQLNAMTSRIKKLIKENVERETIAKDFQIKALQSQINSHFLQNTLESIKMLAYINEDYEVSDALTNLGRILRYGMDWKNPIVTFEEEMEYLERYIDLFSFRIEHPITFRYYIDEELLKKEIPKMLIQPLVENSILHGIIPKDEPGFIQIRAYVGKNKDTRVIEILDNGVGTSNITNSTRSGIGMKNLNDRLKLHFKGNISFEVESIENKFTRIIIKVD